VRQVSCNGGSDGTASVSLTGGVGPFTYKWTPSGGTSPTATGLSTGTYTVEVTGKHHCVSVLSIDIAEPAPVQVSATPIPVYCFGGSNGKIFLNVSGGTSPYNYSWSNVAGNTQSPGNLPAGNYSVTVTDSKGCTGTAQSTVAEP